MVKFVFFMTPFHKALSLYLFIFGIESCCDFMPSFMLYVPAQFHWCWDINVGLRVIALSQTYHTIFDSLHKKMAEKYQKMDVPYQGESLW